MPSHPQRLPSDSALSAADGRCLVQSNCIPLGATSYVPDQKANVFPGHVSSGGSASGRKAYVSNAMGVPARVWHKPLPKGIARRLSLWDSLLCGRMLRQYFGGAFNFPGALHPTD